jgi:hypothetical protein
MKHGFIGPTLQKLIILKGCTKLLKKKHFQWWQFSSYKTQSLFFFFAFQNSSSSHVQLDQVKFLKFQHKLGLSGAMGGARDDGLTLGFGLFRSNLQ